MSAGEISKALAARAADVAAWILPGGKKSGQEWKAGSVDGDEGQSLSVRLSGHKAGVWSDFASGESGDLLDLLMASRNCGLVEALTEAKGFLGIADDFPKRPEKNFKRPEKVPCRSAKGVVLDWLVGRGLTADTVAAFRIGERQQAGKVYAVFPYLREGVLINAKSRNVEEKKDMRQEGGAEPCLFGWHLIDPRARTVTIAEGELDAMSLHQVGVPALSVNAGAGNHQWIDNDWDRLEVFSEIFIAYDNDEAGNKGAQEVIQRLGIERCKRVILPAKDANDYLMQGADGSDFHDAFKNAKTMDPQELRQAADFIADAKALFYPDPDAPRDPVLRLEIDYDWFEFRYGELSIWTGYNGHGKSLALSQVLLGNIQQGEQIVVFSGEMSPGRQMKRIIKQATGLDRPTSQYMDAVGDWIRDQLWIFNVLGSATIDRLLEVFLYARKRYGARHFVIDSLMMTDVPEDGLGANTKQKQAIQKLCDFAKRNDCHMHLVAHPRKGDEAGSPGKMGVGGSSHITNGADNVFSVWAAGKDEGQPPVLDDEGNEKPDGILELHKQRNGDVQHRKVMLWFNKEAQQYCVSSRRRPRVYVPFSP